jgi:CubicO group peptidase (beta-lactamase class C family)
MTPSCATPESSDRARVASAFDREVNAFMAARKVPGGALAVVKNGRLIYARGYGWADRDKKVPVHPDSLFRIASLSKPITAVAILQLIEEGKLSLETKAFAFLKLLRHDNVDPRLERVTIRQLLQHTGGWDRNKSFDPMFRPTLIADALGITGPADQAAVIQYMLRQPLDFDPGTRYAYSNFGYCVLGRVIERITGQSYEKAVQGKVLDPLGAHRMRLGGSLKTGKAKDEVCYYTVEQGLARNVFRTPPERVPWPYGGFHLEAMDAHGGWIASVVDLARFAARFDAPGDNPLLKRASVDVMYEPPPPPVSRNPDGALEKSWYGCGWAVRPAQRGKANYWHSGSLPGTATLLVRRWDGLSWAVLFNQRSEDKRLPDDAIDSALHRAADSLTHWPKGDLFSGSGSGGHSSRASL